MKGIYCLSVSHRYADIEVRSRYGRVFQNLEVCVKELKNVAIVKEAIIISTCNRFEIIFLGDDINAVIAWVAFKCNINHDEVMASFKLMHGIEVLKHIYKVAAGLDSKIFGETNINGQIKQALEIANTHQLASKTLNFIYQHAFMVSKKIQANLALPITSLTHCLDKVFENHLACPIGKTFAIFGSGKLSIEIVKKIMNYRLDKLYVVTRNPQRVNGYLRDVASNVCVFDELIDTLPYVDACFTATNVVEPILNSSHLELFDKNKNVFILDSSLPPAVCPTVKNYQNITYYDIDDLAKLSEEKNTLMTKKRVEEELETFIEASVFALCKKLDSHFFCSMIQPERLRVKEYIQHIQSWVQQEAEHHNNPEKALALVLKELSGVLMHMTSLLLKECCKNFDVDMIQELQDFINKHDNMIKKAINE